jgi:hypothetical protein
MGKKLTQLADGLADLHGAVLLVHVARDGPGAVTQPEAKVLHVTTELLGDLRVK